MEMRRRSSQYYPARVWIIVFLAVTYITIPEWPQANGRRIWSEIQSNRPTTPSSPLASSSSSSSPSPIFLESRSSLDLAISSSFLLPHVTAVRRRDGKKARRMKGKCPRYYIYDDIEDGCRCPTGTAGHGRVNPSDIHLDAFAHYDSRCCASVGVSSDCSIPCCFCVETVVPFIDLHSCHSETALRQASWWRQKTKEYQHAIEQVRTLQRRLEQVKREHQIDRVRQPQQQHQPMVPHIETSNAEQHQQQETSPQPSSSSSSSSSPAPSSISSSSSIVTPPNPTAHDDHRVDESSRSTHPPTQPTPTPLAPSNLVFSTDHSASQSKSDLYFHSQFPSSLPSISPTSDSDSSPHTSVRLTSQSSSRQSVHKDKNKEMKSLFFTSLGLT